MFFLGKTLIFCVCVYVCVCTPNAHSMQFISGACSIEITSPCDGESLHPHLGCLLIMMGLHVWLVDILVANFVTAVIQSAASAASPTAKKIMKERDGTRHTKTGILYAKVRIRESGPEKNVYNSKIIFHNDRINISHAPKQPDSPYSSRSGSTPKIKKTKKIVKKTYFSGRSTLASQTTHYRF